MPTSRHGRSSLFIFNLFIYFLFIYFLFIIIPLEAWSPLSAGTPEGQPPLLVSAQMKQGEQLEWLLRLGANPESTNSQGDTSP